jgi:hypothetical protein
MMTAEVVRHPNTGEWVHPSTLVNEPVMVPGFRAGDPIPADAIWMIPDLTKPTDSSWNLIDLPFDPATSFQYGPDFRTSAGSDVVLGVSELGPGGEWVPGGTNTSTPFKTPGKVENAQMPELGGFLAGILFGYLLLQTVLK